jgi:hypothetical protein
MYVNTGLYLKYDFKEAGDPVLETRHLGPCVSVLTSDGTLAHLNPDFGEIDAYVGWLKKHSDPKTAKVALIGGMDPDPGTRYRYFESSAAMVDTLKKALGKAGFNIVYEDLYGMRQRAVSMDASGLVTVTDGWNEGYRQTYQF